MWVKICGIRDAGTAEMVARFQPDAVGLNFFPPSPRFVNLESAKAITSAIPEEISIVGVFVNAPVCEIATIAYQARLDYAQLHGDEPPEFLAELQDALPEVRLIRACRIAGGDFSELAEHLEALKKLGVRPAGCLLDARVEGLYGGTGKTLAWDLVRDHYDFENWPPLILAGGLNAKNIRSAIETAQPWGVDVAGGVEDGQGNKDAGQVQKFIEQARTAEGC